MKHKSPKKTDALAATGAAIVMTAGLQILHGGDFQDFCKRFTLNALAALFVVRIRALAGATEVQEDGRMGLRVGLHAVFWVVLAVVLFFVFRHFR